MNLPPLFAVLDILAPVFLIVLLGVMLRRIGFLSEAFSSSLNKLVFWFALPSLLFSTIATSTFRKDCLDSAAVLMLTTLVVAVVAWYAAPMLGVGIRSRGAFTQSTFRGNNAYVGIPILVIAYAGHEHADTIQSLAMLTLAPAMVLYNVLAVVVLTPVDPHMDSRLIDWRRITLGILRNPLILASVAGCVALAAELRPPQSITRTLNSLGALAGPGALIALGASLTPERMRAALRDAHLASFFKLVACPAVGWVIARLWGLDADARFITLIYLACPTAVASFVMAEAMKGDAKLAGGAVAVSTLYSILALALVIILAGPS